jgi:Spy/CpxP family protein refolding chaperone
MTTFSLRRYFSATAAVLIVGLLGTSAIFAQPNESTTRPARPGQGPGGREPGMMVRMLRERLDKLDLSADQKKQIDGILSDTESQMRKIMQESRSTTQEDRRDKIRTVMQDLREKIGGVLTDEQKQKLQEEMDKLRASGGGQMNPLNRLRDNLDKLGLSDDQKTKATAVVDDAQKKQNDMRDQIENGNGDPQQIQEKRQQLREDVQKKLAEILTQDQQDKLRDLMQAGGPDGPPGEGGPDSGQRPNARPGAGQQNAKPPADN